MRVDHRSVEAALVERVKELTCLHGIASAAAATPRNVSRTRLSPLGTSPDTGGMTAKSSIRNGACCINPASTRETVWVLPCDIRRRFGRAD